MQWMLLAAPLLPLVAAGAIGGRTIKGPAAGPVAAMAVLGSLVLSLAVLVSAAVSGSIEVGTTSIGLVADRPASILMVLVSAVTVVVLNFARRSLDGDPNGPRFFALASLLASSTMLVATASGAGFLVGAWIATGLTLAAMVGHHRHWGPATAASRTTRNAFIIGDLPLLGAVILSIATVGDLALPADPDALDRSFDLGVGSVSLTTVVAVALVIAGASRSALVPFHRWLPATLAAPTPVSAMLHAGVVNGAGVLLIRFAPVVAVSSLAFGIAFVVGLATAVWATAAMLVRPDVKGGLVYSTAGQMGFMTLQLAVGAFAAALFHIVGHAMYKAALFLGAGGAITAAADRRHLPSARPAIGTAGRVAISAAAPALAMATSLLVFRPHLTTAAAMLVILFGWASAATALNGWLSAPPFAPVRSAAIGAAASFVAVVGYVGGLTVFEKFVASSVPFESPAAVGPVWLGVSLGTIAIAALVLRHGSAPAITGLRRRIYVGLLGAGYVDRNTLPSPPLLGEQRLRRPAGTPAAMTSPVREGAK